MRFTNSGIHAVSGDDGTLHDPLLLLLLVLLLHRSFPVRFQVLLDVLLFLLFIINHDCLYRDGGNHAGIRYRPK